MRKLTHTAAFLAAILGAMPLNAADVQTQINWSEFLGRNDPIWNATPKDWNSAIFTGNGLQGANLFLTEDGKYLKWHIGRSDVVTAGARIPIGDMILRTKGTVKATTARLDLHDAVASGEITTTAGHVRFRFYTHADQLVNVLEISPDAGEADAHFEFLVLRGGAEGGATRPSAETSGTADVAEDKFSVGWRELPFTNETRTMFVTVGYGKNARNDALATLDKAAATPADQLLKTHQEWWHNFWQQAFISIPDARMESFYYIQMYKLASATRKDRVPIDLMGPWFRHAPPTPWTRMWFNLNTQLTYWPIYTGNHLDLGDPILKMLEDHKDQLAKNTRQYAEDSYALGRSASYDLARAAGPETSDLTWLLHNVWLQYKYSMDDTLLRDHLYPLLKGSVNFTLHLLQKGPDGKLHITRGYSPEYPAPQDKTNDPDTNYDLALLRWGCTALLDANERLHLNDPLAAKWKATLADLTPYPTDENGYRISATVADAESHRHYSHLMMIYPLHLVTPDDPANLPLITKSIDHWTSMTNAFRGFSHSGASSLYATLGNGEKAYEWLDRWITRPPNPKFAIQPNTMYAEAGPVIESPLSMAASINDMLLQSYNGKLRIFPAVPKKWADAAFENLRAEGAFLVTAVRQGGETRLIKIESLAGEPASLVTTMESPGIAGKPLEKLAPNEYALPLKKGETAVITPGGAPANAIITPVKTTGEEHYWGLK